MAFNLLGLMTAGAQFGQGFNTGNQQALQAKFLQEKQAALEAYQQGRVTNGANANTIRSRGQDLTNNKSAASEYDKFVTSHPEGDPALIGDMIDSRFGTNIGQTVRGLHSGSGGAASAATKASISPPTIIPAVPGATPSGLSFTPDGQTVPGQPGAPATPPAAGPPMSNGPQAGTGPLTSSGMFGPTDRSLIAGQNNNARLQVGAGHDQTGLKRQEMGDDTRRSISADNLGVRLQLGTDHNNAYQQSVDQQLPVAKINAGARVGAARIQANGAIQVGAGHDATNRFDTAANNNARIITTRMNNDTSLQVGAGHDNAADYRTDASTAIAQKAQQYKQYTNDPYLKDIQARLGWAASEVKRGQGIVNNSDNQKNSAARSGSIAGEDKNNLDNSENVNITNGQTVIQKNLAEAQRLQGAADAYIAKKYGGAAGGGRFTAPAATKTPAIKSISSADLVRYYHERGLGGH